MKKWMWEKETKTWNEKTVRITATLTAVTLVAGCAGVGMIAGSSPDQTGEAAAASREGGAQVAAVRNNRLGLNDADLKNLSKDETVYVISGADGSTQKIIVSDWIKNAMGSSQIEDVTELSDISNVKGLETFSSQGNGTGIWDAGGNDIYYQGNIEKELPVEMKVSYTLDGAGISPDQLAGKSGHVVMRFTYTNRQKQTAQVGDEERELYVPFAVVTTMMLDNEKFRNVEVSSGKVINDGEHLLVAGLAMPGMQENLDVEKEDLDIPDYVEISGDVTDFSLVTTMTVVTNEVFNDLDLENVDSLDELSDSMDDLEEAMNELLDGTNELYDGITELHDKSGELTDGIAELRDGARDLNNGAVELRNGAQELQNGAEELRNGAAALDQGLKTLVSNNETLNNGAKQVFETLLATAETQLKAAGVPLTTKLTIENYGTVLEQIGASMTPEQVKAMAEQTALAKVTEAVEQNRPAVEAGVAQAVKATIRQKIEAQLAAGGAMGASQEEKDGENSLGITGEEAQNPDGKTLEETKALAPQDTSQSVLPADGSAANGQTGGVNGSGNTQGDAPSLQPEAGDSPAAGSAPEAGENTQTESKAADNTPTEGTGESTPATAPGASSAPAPEVQESPEAAPQSDPAQEPTEATGDEMAALGTNLSFFREMGSGRKASVVANSWSALAASPDLEAKINAMVEAQFQTAEVQAQYQAAVQAKMEELIQQNMQSPEVQQQISAAVQAAVDGAGSLAELKKSLDSYNQFYQGLLTYTAGVARASSGSGQLAGGSQKLYDGTKELVDGTGRLQDGTGKLQDGTHELQDGGDKLIDGIQQLWEGGQELVDGVNEFNEEGIQKLVETFDDDVQGLVDRLRAIQDVSKGYRSFAGISDEMEGNVKFIYKTEGIGED